MRSAGQAPAAAVRLTELVNVALFAKQAAFATPACDDLPSLSSPTSAESHAQTLKTAISVSMATPNTSGAIARITKEIANIQRGSDLSLAVACRDSDVRHVRGLIIGPPETPYEFGFFEFDIKFGKEYPIKSR